MRLSVSLVIASLTLAVASAGSACSGGDAPGTGSTDEPAFKVVSPDLHIAAGQEIVYCYYFHMPNTATVAIQKWVSDMTPGSHHMILYFTDTPAQPDGTVNTCESGGAGIIPVWTYASQTPHQESAMPADDGTGTPLAQEIAPGQAAYLQMHYLNASDAAITVHVEIDAFGYAPGTRYVKTAPYITYNSSISIPPGATNHVETQTCNVPAGIRFWSMSTHAHKQSVHTDVKDGDAVLFQSTDWEHPGGVQWSAPSYYSFASGKLTYECTYANVKDNAGITVVDGPSAATNEMCMAVGYFFPANTSRMCLNNLLVR
jgi:hypothetical protein